MVLFSVGATRALVKLIPHDRYQAAVRTWESLGSLAFIAGGMVGGTVVSAVKCSGAFMVDMVSFVAALILVGSIKTDTRPIRARVPSAPALRNRLGIWVSDMKEGLVVLRRVRFLLGVSAVLALMLRPNSMGSMS